MGQHSHISTEFDEVCALLFAYFCFDLLIGVSGFVCQAPDWKALCFSVWKCRFLFIVLVVWNMLE